MPFPEKRKGITIKVGKLPTPRVFINAVSGETKSRDYLGLSQQGFIVFINAVSGETKRAADVKEAQKLGYGFH